MNDKRALWLLANLFYIDKKGDILLRYDDLQSGIRCSVFPPGNELAEHLHQYIERDERNSELWTDKEPK